MAAFDVRLADQRVSEVIVNYAECMQLLCLSHDLHSDVHAAEPALDTPAHLHRKMTCTLTADASPFLDCAAVAVFMVALHGGERTLQSSFLLTESGCNLHPSHHRSSRSAVPEQTSQADPACSSKGIEIYVNLPLSPSSGLVSRHFSLAASGRQAQGNPIGHRTAQGCCSKAWDRIPS